jgi:hypothetical protein
VGAGRHPIEVRMGMYEIRNGDSLPVWKINEQDRSVMANTATQNKTFQMSGNPRRRENNRMA